MAGVVVVVVVVAAVVTVGLVFDALKEATVGCRPSRIHFLKSGIDQFSGSFARVGSESPRKL